MRWSMNRLAGAGAFAAAIAASAPAAAGVDAFLQIEGAAGGSQARPGWIELSSFQWGVGRGIGALFPMLVGALSARMALGHAIGLFAGIAYGAMCAISPQPAQLCPSALRM